MAISTSLIAEFRRRIKDVRYSKRVMGVAVSDPNVNQASAEITRGHFYIHIVGGRAPNIDINLTDTDYDTINNLYQRISRSPGISVSLDEDANLEQASIDLEPFGPIPILGTGISLNSHLFSDSELEEVLKEAIQRHNPSLSLDTLPQQEEVFVLALAQAGICRIQAMDSSKRQGVDKDVGLLLKLADSFESQYKSDTARLARAIQSPKEANSNLVSEGDVMLGDLTRRSLRTGFKSQISQTIDPSDAVLLPPDEHDTEDDNLRLIWQRNKNNDFYSYELWMDYTPDVVRTREGGLVFAGTPISYLATDDTRHQPGFRATTSVMVFRSFGANSNSSRSSFSTFVEEFGQLIRSFAVGDLEPEMDYYFRLYLININYLSIGSNVVKGTTKPYRCRMLSTQRSNNSPGPVGAFADKASGPAGTVVTVTLDSTRAAFTPDYTFRIGGKVVTPTILSPYSIQVTIPTFNVIGPKDFSVTSPNGLVDVRNSAFTVSAT